MNTSSVSRSRTGPKTLLVLGLGVCLLALGWWLRTAHLGSMSQLLHHDEAWYALNAVDLIEHPRFVTFFPENYGRESSWMYVLAGWMLTIGRGIAELRLLAALVGVLTLAATYRLARELFGVRVGLGALATLTVLFWHVMISSHVVRLNFALLLVALAGLAWAQTALEKAPSAPASTAEPAKDRTQSAQTPAAPAAPQNSGTTLEALGQLVPSTIKLFHATSDALGTLKGANLDSSYLR